MDKYEAITRNSDSIEITYIPIGIAINAEG